MCDLPEDIPAFMFFFRCRKSFDIRNENIFIRVPLNYLALKWFDGVCSTISSIKRLFVLVFALRLMGDRVLFIKMIAAVIYWQSRKWNANIHNSFLFPANTTIMEIYLLITQHKY